MLWQVFRFAFVLFFGAYLGSLFKSPFAASLTVIAISMGWYLLEHHKRRKILKWLAQDVLTERPQKIGDLSFVVDRFMRLLIEQRKINSNTHQRLQDFLSAIQASPNGVLLLDAELRIEWCNQTAADHLGIDMRRDVRQFISNLVRDPLFSSYLKLQDQYTDVVIETRDSRPENPKKISIQLYPYGEGRRLLLSRDITLLEQAEMMRRDFVANVSHEIRTPLTVLSGFIETMLNLPVEEVERKRYLELMSQQAGRMQTLVNDLLTLSKLEGSTSPSRSEWTPLIVLWQQCVQEAWSLSKVLYTHSTQKIILNLDEQVQGLEICGSRNELLSAMTNLVSNAVRYTPEDGTIQVSLSALQDGGVEFKVIDFGPGIAPEHLSRLTERFYRVDRSRSRESGGTGLGLAIVKHVAQRHDTQLLISSQLAQGSEFSLRVPPQRIRKS